MATKKDPPLFPPDETLWQKYSSHFELPLASATSLVLHGLVIGLMAIGGIGFFWPTDVEANRPPRMDVVMLEGDGEGSGFDGGGGAPGLPGRPDGGGPDRTELVTPLPNQPNLPDERPMPNPAEEKLPELGVPILNDPASSGDLVIELQRIRDEAERKSSPEPTPKLIGIGEPKKAGLLGTGNPKGQGGLGGAGSGTGAGNKTGSGMGKGGFGGRKVSKQEIYALRWSFDLSGDGREHARKLAAIGVNVGVIDPKGNFFNITDLNRRPVELRPAQMPNLKEVVGWENRSPNSIQQLASEMRLPFVPRSILLLLPKEREEKMAAEEARFAGEQGRNLSTVRRTWFDFRLRNGAYDPVGIRFE